MERRGDLYQRYLTLLSELARLYEDAGDRFATLPGNLPTPLTPIIGFERDLVQLNDLLQRARLLTLTGPGGCGKTRLAQELAQVSARGFPDGAWWVDVAPLSDSALVPLAVASVLGVPERPEQPVAETLADRLRDRRALLVLDNAEHLLAKCTALAEALLQACAHLRVLVTSREPLGVPGEMRWPVPLLSLPPPDVPRSPDDLLQYDAIRLFVARGHSVNPSFALTPGNARAVAEICRCLDGLPLAIELAAARLSHLTPAEMALRLGERFALLSLLGRGSHRRHETLRSCFDCQYALLSTAERRLYNRLAVFTGTFTLEAVESVCGEVPLEPDGVLALLSRLVDKSLVMVDELGGPSVRYRMLETIREHARERLEASGDAEQIRIRYAEYLLERGHPSAS